MRRSVGTRAFRISALSAVSVIAAVALVASWPRLATAGSTGQTNLLYIVGSGSNVNQGDYVSNASGLDTYYSFFVEVPAGASSLQVDLFDADINLASGTSDVQVGGTSDTRVRYRVIDPSGTSVFNQRLAAASCGTIGGGTCDGVWANIYTGASPTAGHWEIRVDQSSAQQNSTGDDVNGLGIRAHDGTSGAGGTEYNVYALSYLPVGRTSSGSNAYLYYPWVNSGCSLDANDFDTDRSTISGNSWAFANRDSTFSQTYANANLSKNNQWKNNTLTGFTTAQAASGYGIWPATFTIAADATTTTNYATLYLGRYSYSTPSAPAPSAQPEASTTRIYLPTDAAAAPNEPYMEQYIGHRSGTNPITKNSNTILEITQRVYNPTAQSINFSGTFGGNTRELQIQISTANAYNTYQGTSSLTTGSSLTSGPSSGAQGLFHWTPGTLAAGSNAALSYRVNSLPTKNTTYNITGAETSRASSTLALYTDGTGNTTQAAANPELGGLCPLTETNGTTVFAELSNVAAHRRGNVRTVEWDTTVELGTTGFVVERLDALTGTYRRIHEGYVPALMAAQGGHYVVVDPTPGNGIASYVISDIDARHEETAHGPFTLSVTAAPGATPPNLSRDGFASVARAWPSRTILTHADTRPFGLHRRADTAPGDDIHMAIRERGLTRVDVASLASAFGRTADELRADLAAGHLALSRLGAPVAWAATSDGASLVFFADPVDSIYSRDTIYRLSRADGVRMLSEAVGAPGSGASADTFLSTQHIEQDLFPGTAVAPDPESDYWHWKVVSSLNPDLTTVSFELPLEHVATSATVAHLTLTAFGITNNPHYFQVRVNGTDVGRVQFSYFGTASASVDVPAGVLHDGVNSLELTAERVDTVDSSIYVDSFDVTYARAYSATNASAIFDSAAANNLSVSGFSAATVSLFDVTNGATPKALTGADVAVAGGGEFTLSFAGAAARRYAAAVPSEMLTPTRVWPDAPSSLRNTNNMADYIVIAPSELHDQAVRLVDRRLEQGMIGRVVDVEDIYDEFSHGAPNPHAIADFLRYSHSVWATRPRYVALAGTHTYDYRDVLGLGGNLVPSILVRTAHGLFPADNAYVDFDQNGSPDIAIGRLPVGSADEMEQLVDKIAAYEDADSTSWAQSVLLIADAAADADFRGMTDEIGQALPRSVTAETLDLLETNVVDARTRFGAALERGVIAVNYLGHGGSDHLSDQNLLDAAGAAALTNHDRLPIVTAGSCLVSGFGMPGVSSVGESLVRNAGGGSIAVWSPSAISDSAQGKQLAASVLSNVLEGRRRPLGDAVQETVRHLEGYDVSAIELATFALLGDPALLIQAAPDVLDPVSMEDMGIAPQPDSGTTPPVPPSDGGCSVIAPTSGLSIVMLLGCIAMTFVVLRRKRSRGGR